MANEAKQRKMQDEREDPDPDPVHVMDSLESGRLIEIGQLALDIRRRSDSAVEVETCLTHLVSWAGAVARKCEKVQGTGVDLLALTDDEMYPVPSAVKKLIDLQPFLAALRAARGDKMALRGLRERLDAITAPGKA